MTMSEIKWVWHSSFVTLWIAIAGILLRIATICNVKAENHIQILMYLNTEDACIKCGQTEWTSGEYPCPECGRPTLWDEEAPELIHKIGL
jgi:hypothetical protein